MVSYFSLLKLDLTKGEWYYIQVQFCAVRIRNAAGGVEMRVGITLECEECKRRNYRTTKDKSNEKKNRLELKKYCPFCKKHTLHKETK